jgi:hypothetical protein
MPNSVDFPLIGQPLVEERFQLYWRLRRGGSPSARVVDHAGRMFGHPGLHVFAGSIVRAVTAVRRI